MYRDTSSRPIYAFGTAGLMLMLCSMSWMISSMCSMPTETLTISGATPRSIFSCGSIGLCVVDQGCMAVVFASPYLTRDQHK